MGWRLDDVGYRFSWLDIKALINCRRDDSALARSFDPEWRWTPTLHVLAGIFDQLAGANSQCAHGAENDRPKPLPRPGGGSGTSGIGRPRCRWTNIGRAEQKDAGSPRRRRREGGRGDRAEVAGTCRIRLRLDA